MITCVKIAPYELRPIGEDTYDYLAGLAAGAIDPPSLAPKSLSFPGSIILHSPLRRSVECIDGTAALSCEARESLKEISFDMRDFCDRTLWEREGSRAVRRGFKTAFIEDTLPIRRTELILSAHEMLEEAKAAAERAPVVLVSHSFRLKLIEAYIRSNGRLAEEPALIGEYIHDEQKTYAFGEGFTIE